MQYFVCFLSPLVKRPTNKESAQPSVTRRFTHHAPTFHPVHLTSDHSLNKVHLKSWYRCGYRRWRMWCLLRYHLAFYTTTAPVPIPASHSLSQQQTVYVNNLSAQQHPTSDVVFVSRPVTRSRKLAQRRQRAGVNVTRLSYAGRSRRPADDAGIGIYTGDKLFSYIIQHRHHHHWWI